MLHRLMGLLLLLPLPVRRPASRPSRPFRLPLSLNDGQRSLDTRACSMSRRAEATASAQWRLQSTDRDQPPLRVGSDRMGSQPAPVTSVPLSFDAECWTPGRLMAMSRATSAHAVFTASVAGLHSPPCLCRRRCPARPSLPFPSLPQSSCLVPAAINRATTAARARLRERREQRAQQQHRMTARERSHTHKHTHETRGSTAMAPPTAFRLQLTRLLDVCLCAPASSVCRALPPRRPLAATRLPQPRSRRR